MGGAVGQCLMKLKSDNVEGTILRLVLDRR